MPPLVAIPRQMIGAWRMMTGRRDAVRMLDVSADGFWNSFFAVVVALPVMLVGWVPMAGELSGADATFGQRFGILVRLALVDLGAWVLPIAALAAAASHIGIRDRFAHYVVASNWGSAIFAWMVLPASLMRLVWPGGADIATAIALGIFILSLVLSWRLTDAAIDKGAGMTTGVFAGMFFASLLTLFALQDILRLQPQ